MSQKSDILRHLKSHRGSWITPLDALGLFGCMSLSQRIGNLKREGVKIADKWVVRLNGKRVKAYSIPKGKK